MPPKIGKKTFFNYTEDALKAALEDVQIGQLSIRKASRKNGIPFATLYNKVKGKTPKERRMGPNPILTNAEEQLLVDWINAYAKKGFPLKRRTLFENVKCIVKDDNRVTPFKNWTPGEKWFQGFIRRNPSIAERNAEAINQARATVTEPKLREWFKELHKYLEEEDCLDILLDGSRIYNADESGFQTCPKTGKVLGPISFNNLYEIKTGKEKEAITVMANFNGSGEVVPGMIVFPLQKVSREIAQNVPEDWGIGRSKKGWMRGGTYYEYIANVFLPWLKKTNVQFPILLLVDGHKSHLTLEVAKFCAENKILQYALYPNATHILQPADVAVFRPLKVRWRDIVSRWKISTGNKVVTKSVFGPLIAQAFCEGATPVVIKNGFRKCGLFPFDPDAVDYSRCISSEKRLCPPTVNQVNVKETLSIQTLLYLESHFKKGRVDEFRRAGQEWEGDPEALELFQFWKVLRNECMQLPNLTEDNTSMIDASIPPSDSFQLLEHSISPNISLSPIGDPLTLLYGDEALLNFTPNPVGDKEQSPHPLGISTPADGKSRIPARHDKSSVSPAFAQHIQWPHDSPEKKKTAKRRLPYATTSKAWIKSVEDKEKEKKDKKEIIQKKKEDKIKQKQVNAEGKVQVPAKRTKRQISESSDSSVEVSSGESIWAESEDEAVSHTEWQPVQKFVDEYVATKYDDKYFPGVIIEIQGDGATVSSMVASGRLWKWPEKKDVLFYKWDKIVGHIACPHKTSKTRNVFSVPELNRFL